MFVHETEYPTQAKSQFMPSEGAFLLSIAIAY